MEASHCVNGSYYRAGGPQFVGGGVEKKAAGGGGDHFLVEDLLDFSNEEEAVEDNGVNRGDDGGFEAEAETGAGNSSDSSSVTAVNSCNSSFSGGGDQHFSGDLVCLSGDLCEPYEELAELEWLSNFVEEDSFSSEDLQKFQLISGVQSGSGPGSVSSSSDTRGSSSSSIEIPSSASPGGKLTAPIQQQPAPFFLPEAAAVPGKARSKRSRTAPNNWSSRLLVLCPSAAATSSSDSDFILLHPNPVRKAPKLGRRKEIPPLMAPSDGRRCLHCATDKTPQWRTGPMGPKTLCNACGVRYKSGRLVPEYRPAASPTFVLSRHSNSHRKVLELRRQKEVQQQFIHPGGPGSVFDRAGPVPSAGDEQLLIHHHLGPDFRQLI